MHMDIDVMLKIIDLGLAVEYPQLNDVHYTYINKIYEIGK